MNDVARIENPFSAPVSEPASGAVAKSDEARAIQEVQAAMVIAKKFPRDPVAATDRILLMCTRPGLAEAALYSYSRGGADVTGPSIRLAEAMAQAWGNMQFGIRELSQDTVRGESTVEAFAWDLETNTRQTKVFSVPHLRFTRQGSRRLEDPRDIYETVANNGARRLRACILGVIPGDVVEAALKQCEVTLNTKADVSPEGIKKMVDAFAALGVSAEQLKLRIGCHLEAMRPAQLVQLRKIYNSLRDGMSQPADWFQPVAGAATTAGAEGPQSGARAAELKDRLRNKNARVAAPASSASGAPAVSFAAVAELVNKAASDDDLAAAADMARGLPDDQKAEIDALIAARAEALAKAGV